MTSDKNDDTDFRDPLNRFSQEKCEKIHAASLELLDRLLSTKRGITRGQQCQISVLNVSSKIPLTLCFAKSEEHRFPLPKMLTSPKPRKHPKKN